MASGRLVNRNVIGAHGRRTSVRLEPEYWEALGEYCARERVSVDEVVRAVDAEMGAGGRTSGLRVRLMRYFREAATADGHRLADHGAPP